MECDRRCAPALTGEAALQPVLRTAHAVRPCPYLRLIPIAAPQDAIR